MKLYILDNGWMEGDPNWMIMLKHFAVKEVRNVLCGWEKFPIYAVLLETSEGKILYDTGHNPNEYDKSNRFPYYYTEEQRMENQLELTGTKPEDIKAVILSHLHDDHVGNLRLFSQAELYMAKDEYNYVKVERENGRNPIGAYKQIEFDYSKIHLVDYDFWLNNQIQVINLPGHCHGLLGLLIHLEKDGTIICAMDSVNTAENYGPPIVPAAGIYNSDFYYQSIEKVRRLEKQFGAQVLFGHDMNQFQTLRKAPEFYS